MKRLSLAVFMVLMLVGIADAQTTIEWRVDYLTRKPVGSTTTFYGDGTYMFLKNTGYVPVYLRNVNWIFIGMEEDNTSPAMLSQYGVAALPEGFPDISFPTGYTVIMVTPIVVHAAYGGAANLEAIQATEGAGLGVELAREPKKAKR